MRILPATFLALCTVGLIGAPQSLFAQSASSTKPHVPLEKSIGQAKPEVVPSLFVLNSKGASLKDGKLVLAGISPTAIVFADRPVRSAGHDLTTRIVEDWGNGTDNFAKDPPNATVSAFKRDGSAVLDAVVVLKSPKIEGDKLTFDVDVLEGDLAGADGPASVFIDIIGRPFTPLSFAGVARRTAWRGAYYRGAAVAGERQPSLEPLRPIRTTPRDVATTHIRLATRDARQSARALERASRAKWQTVGDGRELLGMIRHCFDRHMTPTQLFSPGIRPNK